MANADRLIEIFDEAKARPAGAERERFLAEKCQDAPELKEQVISLLQSHEGAGDFLKHTMLSSPILITEKPGDAIGRYKLLEKVGEGGCGVVYVAEQTEPVRRRVALKVIKLGMDTRQVVARFEAERQALAMMDHPNIAKVLEAGSTDTGRPYFVMDLVRGIPITDFCDQNNLSTRERLDLFIKVCQAIQHAHQKGIIHRDIKPSNILVTLHDGVPVPKVIDFGIAKATEGRLTDATVYTQLLHFIGTPAYMSPEQAEMSGLDIDTRSDIYSLGVLLYELLTGKTPFDGQKMMDSGIDAMRKTIREKEPVRPSTQLTRELVTADMSPGKATVGLAIPSDAEVAANSRRQLRLKEQINRVSGDLDWIVMKCLEKDRSRRYETANGLAADLNRHLNNEPVTARPPSAVYRFQKMWRRNKIMCAATAAVAATLLLGTIISTWQTLEAKKQRDNARQAQWKAELAEHKAKQSRLEAEHNLYVANINLAGQAWERNNFQGVREVLEATRAAPNRGFEWYYWQRQAHLNLKTLLGQVGRVNSLAFSPDGRKLASGGADRTVRIWSVATGHELLTLKGHTRGVSSVIFSLDGQSLVSGSTDQTVRFWDSSTGAELAVLAAHQRAINSVAFSLNGDLLVTGGNDGTAKIWDAFTHTELVTLTGHTGAVRCASFSPDGKTVVTGSDDRTTRVWSTVSGEEVFKISHETEIDAALFSPDGLRIVTGGLDPAAKMWDATTGKPLKISLEVNGTTRSLAYSADGKHIVSGSWDSTARLLNATNGHAEQIFLGHVKGLFSVAISPEGTRIATASNGGEIKIWATTDERESLRVDGPNLHILAAAISRDNQRIVTGTGLMNLNGTVTGSGAQAATVWDMKSQNKVVELSGHRLGISSVAFSPTGKEILTGSGDSTAMLWDATSGALLQTFRGHTNSVNSVAFLPNSSRVVTGSLDYTCCVWDVSAGRELLKLVHTAPVNSVATSLNGRWVLTGCFDGSVTVWDAASGNSVHKTEMTDRILTVSFSPDSRRIFAAGFDRVGMVWDLRDLAAEPLMLKGHGSVISSSAFSPDGLRIVTGSFDGTARVWEADTGRELLRLSGPSQALHSVAFSADGLRIITSGTAKVVQIFEAATPDQVALWEAEDRAMAESQTDPRK